MSHLARYLIFGCLVAFVAPHCAVAQNPEAQNTQELRRQLDELKAQMSEQMRQMSTLQTRIEEMERAKTLAPPPATASDQPPSVPTKQVSESTSNYQTFGEDPEAAARVNNAPLGS